MGNNYAVTLEHKPLVAAYFISVVPVRSCLNWCLYFGLRPSTYDNVLKLLKFRVTLSLVPCLVSSRPLSQFRVQDMNFKFYQIITYIRVPMRCARTAVGQCTDRSPWVRLCGEELFSLLFSTAFVTVSLSVFLFCFFFFVDEFH